MTTDERQTEFGWTVDLMTKRTSLAASQAARDEAVVKVGEAAEADGWMDVAIDAIRRVAMAKDEFTADDVWQTGLEAPREGRALGAAFTRLQRDGEIEATPIFKSTVRASRHAAPIRVWKSKLRHVL